jgi:hypothetical protein
MPSPIPSSMLNVVAGAISGSRAHTYVCEIAKHHRIQASPMYREAAEWVAERLRDFGLDEVRVHEFASDGRLRYQTWPTAVGWTVEGAGLWRVGPDGRDVEKLADFADHPMHLVTLSRSADVTGSLVDVGSGEKDGDYADIDVAGRIVLGSGNGGQVHRQAVIRRGALGVVCYPTEEDKQGPDTFKYTGMWPVGDERDHVTWGFNISRRTAEGLQARLACGKDVRLHAVVRDGFLFDSTLDVLTALIPGTDPAAREVLLVAHLCHPYQCAEDNASGVAALMETADVIASSIKAGRLDRPRRNIRFMWVPEWYGTIAYLDAHPRVGDRTLAVINCDMVGADALQTQSKLTVSRGPRSLPSFLGDLMESACESVAELNPIAEGGNDLPFEFVMSSTGGGSDDFMFCDGAIRVPATMLNRGPDPFHHTNLDTPDLVGKTELGRSAAVCALAAYWMAAARGEVAAALADVMRERAQARIAAALEKAKELVAGDEGDWTREELARDALLAVQGASAVEAAALASLGREFGIDASARQREVAAVGAHAVEELSTDLAARGISPADPPQHPLAAVVARRLTRGPVHWGYVESRLDPDRQARQEAAGARIGEKRYEIVNYIDGKRAALAIRDLVTAHAGPTRLADVIDCIEDLEAVQVVELFR